MADSEYYVQIFLFVATIMCYILLAVFVFYGIYYCCVRACILRTKRKRPEDDNEEDQHIENHGYCRHVKLLYPFHRDEKKAFIAPNSNTFKNTPANSINVDIDDNTSILDEKNPFVDKKYYDIFVA